MSNPTPIAPTIGEIARRLGYPLHRVAYVVRSRRLVPAARAGSVRLFNDEQVQEIRNELECIDAHRERGPR